MSEESPRAVIAREARALRRDNAKDATTRAIRVAVPDLDHESASYLSEAVIAELSAWFRQRSSPTLTGDPFILAADWAAALLEDFTVAPAFGGTITEVARGGPSEGADRG